MVTQTANILSFIGTFQQGGTFGQQTRDLGSLHGQSCQCLSHKSSSHEHRTISGTFQQGKTFGPQTANLGGFIGTFLCPSLALFDKVMKFNLVNQTADLGSF